MSAPPCQGGLCGFESRLRRVITPCFKCGYVAEPVDQIHVDQPYGATIFTSHGHYGSTIYDPMSNYRHLRIIICDSCLLQHHAKVREVFVSPRASIYDYLEWNPEPKEEEEP